LNPVYDLSYDPQDPYFTTPDTKGLMWAVQVFTTGNVYGLSPDARLVEDQAAQRFVLSSSELRWAGQQQRRSGRVEVRVAISDGAITWDVTAWHDEPIKAIKLLFTGELLAGRGLNWWHAGAKPEETWWPSVDAPVTWHYPYPEWPTPWACAGADDRAVALSIRDRRIRAKRFYAKRHPTSRGQIVELIAEEDSRRWGPKFVAPQFRARVCTSAGEVTNDFEDHMRFVEVAYGVPRWEERRDVPDWARKIKLILNLHGQHWTGYVFNTYRQMTEVLRTVTEEADAGSILAFLPGWEGRYYFDYPNYQPSDLLGGADEFRRFVDSAHALGVRVMPMFGATGANVRQYPDWRRAAFRSRSNRIIELIDRPDWDGDRASEDEQVSLNPGEPRFRRHLIAQIHRTVADFDVDAAFLDTSGVWFNDPRYSQFNGLRKLIRELHAEHPTLLIAGENWWDAILALIPMNQSWFIGPHLRYPQLLNRYGRAIRHSAWGAPGTGSTGVHEAGYQRPTQPEVTAGHIPSINVVHDTLSDHRGEFLAWCRAATASGLAR
jgi:hypothetical protein